MINIIISFSLLNKYTNVTTVVDTKFEPPIKINEPPDKWSTEEIIFDKANEFIFYKCSSKKIIWFLLYL